MVVMISLLLAACEAPAGSGNDPVGGQFAAKPAAAANSLTSQTDRDAIRDQIERCWIVPMRRALSRTRQSTSAFASISTARCKPTRESSAATA